MLRCAIQLDRLTERLRPGFATQRIAGLAQDQVIKQEQVKPKHLIVDQGREFKCKHFEDKWCKQHDVLPRFGAVNKHGSSVVAYLSALLGKLRSQMARFTPKALAVSFC